MIYDPASKKMQSFPNEFVRLLLTRKPKNDSNQYRFWKRTITCSFIIRQEQQIVKVFYFHALGIIENSLQKSENFMQKHKPLPVCIDCSNINPAWDLSGGSPYGVENQSGTNSRDRTHLG